MTTTTGVERLTLAKAITTGLRRSLENDPTVLLMGEDEGLEPLAAPQTPVEAALDVG